MLKQELLKYSVIANGRKYLSYIGLVFGRWIIRKEENVNTKISIRQNKNDELYLFWRGGVIWQSRMVRTTYI